MSGSQAPANIEDENDEGWTWKRKLPRKSECLAGQFYVNKKTTQFNFFYQSEFNLDIVLSFVADTVESNLNCEIVNEEVDIKDSERLTLLF